ncbi:hypothetical protein B9N43_04875 [Denitratisoma sp. DHT3]|uniref:hypothetical protein n=1 Tax=Denitratisoma sp. DHT3 TaxID=1981880 RepID=UPI0011985E87|nr:hypothetical protein [Denitratisoma sp. DHT3]QDX80636.1 hypothetical protein B9N43_04875 [Denitratisoma sp. DHT3]
MKAKTLIATSAFLTLVACSSTPSKSELDAEVRRLCAIDGGVKVYETVGLPASEFNQWGQVKMYQERVENKAAYQHDAKRTVMEFFVGATYVVKTEIFYLRTGSPSLHRYKVEVIRRLDRKLLGESTGYSRGGGDLPGPWQPSSFSCSQEYGDIPLLTRIFFKE